MPLPLLLLTFWLFVMIFDIFVNVFFVALFSFSLYLRFSSSSPATLDFYDIPYGRHNAHLIGNGVTTIQPSARALPPSSTPPTYAVNHVS